MYVHTMLLYVSLITVLELSTQRWPWCSGPSMGWIGLGQKVGKKKFFSKFNFFYCNYHTILGTTALHIFMIFN